MFNEVYNSDVDAIFGIRVGISAISVYELLVMIVDTVVLQVMATKETQVQWSGLFQEKN